MWWWIRPGICSASPTTSNATVSSDALRPTYASVHDTSSIEVHAEDLTLDKFIDDDVLKTAMLLPQPTREIRTVLLTGATGFLGRFLGMEWLQGLADSGGTLVCLTRGADAAQARRRIEAALASDSRAARALPDTGRRPSRGPRRRHRRSLPRSGQRHLAAAGPDRRPHRAPGGSRQSCAAVPPVVRPERRRHRRGDPTGNHRQTQTGSLHLHDGHQCRGASTRR